MSDEDIAKVENIMNKAHELVEQREKYYNYILDWTEKKNAKDKVTNTKNAVTSRKQETATASTGERHAAFRSPQMAEYLLLYGRLCLNRLLALR